MSSTTTKIGSTPINQCIAYLVCGTIIDKFLINRSTWQGAAMFGATATVGAIYSDTFTKQIYPNHKNNSLTAQLATETAFDNSVALPLQMYLGLTSTGPIKAIVGNTLTNLLGTVVGQSIA